MNIRSLFTACLGSALLLSGCGYHLGGLRCMALKNMDTFCVNMFSNHTTQPNVAMQMTTALTNALQRDGSFRMASPSECDCKVDGTVRRITRDALATDSDDTYISSEIGLTVHVAYRVTDTRTNKILVQGETIAEASYFNTEGNTQTSRAAALSYATRKAADNIVYQLTIP